MTCTPHCSLSLLGVCDLIDTFVCKEQLQSLWWTVWHQHTKTVVQDLCILVNIKATAAVPTLRTLPCPPHAVTELCTLRTNTPTNWLHILIWLVTTDKKRNIRSVRSIDKRRWRGNTHTTVTHLYTSASISLRIFFSCSSSSCFLRASSSSNFCSSSLFLSSSSSRSFSHLALLSSLRCTFLSARRFLRSSSSTFSNSFSFSYAHQYDDKSISSTITAHIM